jgi:hypothetical protein
MCRVDEPECSEALFGRLGRERAGTGECLEDRGEEETFVDRSDRGLVGALVGLELLERGRSGRVAIPRDSREANEGQWI